MSGNSVDQDAGSGGIGALWTAARNPPADPTARFDNKSVLVLGATAGVGHEAAIKLANLGAAKLTIGARDLGRAEDAKRLIASKSSICAEDITILDVDFESLASVQAFAMKLDHSALHVDVAIISAGIAAPAYRTCPSGWESSLQVNVLSTALCTVLLLPILKKSGNASGSTSILEIVGSEACLDVQEEWIPKDETILDHYNKKPSFTLERQYHVAKLLLMFVLEGITEAIKGQPHVPTVLVASPGMCRTSLGRDFPFVMRAFMAVFQTFVARSAEQGSRSLVSGAALGPNASGHFWFNDTLDSRKPLLTDASWKKLQVAEFARVMDVLEEQAPGCRSALL